MQAQVRLFSTAVLAAALAACGGDDEAPDVTFVVSFNGLGCRDAGVSSVRLSFEGGTMTGNCGGGGPIGLLFTEVPPGSYTIDAEALDLNGQLAYADEFQITHTEGGTHRYPLDLRPVTELVTRFTFAGVGNQDGMTCAEAGVETVEITLGSSKKTVTCVNQGQDAAALLDVAPGSYEVSMVGLDAGGRRRYSSEFHNVVIQRGSNEYFFNLLADEKGGLEFTWAFQGATTCASAGVATIEYQLVGADGREVYRTPTPLPCARQDGTNGRSTFAHDIAASALDAGLYQLAFIRGLNISGATVYESRALRLYAPSGKTQGFTVTLLRK